MRYGELVELWMDARTLTPEEGGPDLQPIVRKYQPDIIFYHSNERRDHRWCGYSDKGKVDYPCWSTMPPPDYRRLKKSNLPRLLHGGDPDGTHWSPAFSGLPLRSGHQGWFWTAVNAENLRSADQLVRSYYETVGRNANLVLGVCVDQDGLVPESDVRLLERFGKMVKEQFGNPIAETHGTGELYELDLDTLQKVDHIVMMEDIREGHRVRAYEVEGQTAEGTWQQLARGTAIGHKRIESFAPVDVMKVRVRISRSVGIPVLRKIYLLGPK